jgi:TPP-dependent indolepyruvate ferredoxin oxidoreductase alpha subunit
MITEAQLAQGLEDLYNFWSDKTDIVPADARKQFALGQANLIAQFVQGRTTTGTGYQGTPITTIIQ